ncbi:MAG: AraC family transcriptional regulator [Sphaerochaetaceae bacterium]|jgi:AraC family transcriptional regulator|nr:AraC family transcriptional regulator [Sphaerochaetaceae bacterium]
MVIKLPLGGMPLIIQAGLSLHGHLRKQQFLMHDVWGLHLYFYSGKLRFGGNEYTISSRMASITPPNTPLEWEFPDHAPHYYVHFKTSRPCDPALPTEPFEYPIKVMSGPFERFETVVRLMELIDNTYKKDPLKARVALWNLLLNLNEVGTQKEAVASDLPSSVQIVVSYINQHYSTPLVVEELANHAGVSHNYLITLFKRHFGCTVSTYIRRKRCQEAEFLLRHSSLAIRSIAQAVGIPDINHFNKTIRKELGLAPSKIRESYKPKNLDVRTLL